MPALPPMSVVTMPMVAVGSDPQMDSLTPPPRTREELSTPASGSPALRKLVSDADAAFVPLPEPPARPSQPAVSSPALRVSGVHPSTTLGVPPPPPRVGRPQSVAPPVASVPRESRPWLILAAILAVAAGIALAIVLAI
jgi:hypothetical protein